VTVTRKSDTAEGLARAFEEALKPGPHGHPIISQKFGSTDGTEGGFIVTGSESGRTFRVTVEEITDA